MKIFNKMKGQSAIHSTAEHFHQSEEQIRRAMQEALDAAWTTEDAEVKALQEQLFPDGKPTLEQFIVSLSKYIKDR